MYNIKIEYLTAQSYNNIIKLNMQYLKHLTKFNIVFGTTIGITNGLYSDIHSKLVSDKNPYESIHLATICLTKAYVYYLTFPLPLISMAYGGFTGDKHTVMKHFIPNSVHGLEKFRKNFEGYANDEKLKNNTLDKSS